MRSYNQVKKLELMYGGDKKMKTCKVMDIVDLKVLKGGLSNLTDDEIKIVFKVGSRIEYYGYEYIVEKHLNKQLRIQRTCFIGDTKTYNISHFRKLIDRKVITKIGEGYKPIILTDEQKEQLDEIVKTSANTDSTYLSDVLSKLLSLGVERNELDSMLKFYPFKGDKRFEPLMDKLFKI